MDGKFVHLSQAAAQSWLTLAPTGAPVPAAMRNSLVAIVAATMDQLARPEVVTRPDMPGQTLYPEVTYYGKDYATPQQVPLVGSMMPPGTWATAVLAPPQTATLEQERQTYYLALAEILRRLAGSGRIMPPAAGQTPAAGDVGSIWTYDGVVGVADPAARAVVDETPGTMVVEDIDVAMNAAAVVAGATQARARSTLWQQNRQAVSAGIQETAAFPTASELAGTFQAQTAAARSRAGWLFGGFMVGAIGLAAIVGPSAVAVRARYRIKQGRRAVRGLLE